MPTDVQTIPLAGWAGRQIRTLAEMTGAPALHDLCGAGLLVERAALNGFAVPGLVSAGGGCRLMPAQGGWVAINLARPDDRGLLPALFCDGSLDPDDDDAILAAMASCEAAEIVARGREMGLAIARTDETPAGPASAVTAHGNHRALPARAPLVIDLSALWAGPLAAHLLWLAGAQVIKVESHARPDRMRDGDPALFALLNQGKANVALDPRNTADRDALIALIRRADIVIEAARPRALLQLGIDAEMLARSTPGLTWITITGHGAEGDAANWVGFGDDCGVAGGLSATLLGTTGSMGFVGDAIADPLTGLSAAQAAWQGWQSGRASHTILSMSATVRDTIHADDREGLDADLRQWAAAIGRPFPASPPRRPSAAVASLGQDNGAWLTNPC